MGGPGSGNPRPNQRGLMPPIKPGEVRNPQGKTGRPPGPPTNFRGRPLGEKPHRVVTWDLQMAAKEASEEGLEILKGCMRDEACDWPTRLRAIEMLWERGYGRPQTSIAVNATYAFAEVPQVETDVNVWLARKGQPPGPAGDAWLLEHEKAKGTQTAAPQEKRTGEAPSTQGGASKGEVLDLQAEPDISPIVAESTLPLPPEIDKTKLN